MLWAVTRLAPTLGNAEREGLTIRIFSTRFPQPDLRAPSERLRKSICRAWKGQGRKGVGPETRDAPWDGASSGARGDGRPFQAGVFALKPGFASW